MTSFRGLDLTETARDVPPRLTGHHTEVAPGLWNPPSQGVRPGTACLIRGALDQAAFRLLFFMAVAGAGGLLCADLGRSAV